MTPPHTRFVLALALTLGCSAARPALVSPAVAATPPPAAAAPAPTPLAWGISRGALDPSTGVRAADGRLMREYSVDLAAGQRARFVMASREFDPRLVLDGPGGLHVDNDDAFPGSTDAAVMVVAPAAGRYTLRATALSSGESGAYALRADAPSAPADGTPLALDASVDATLGGPVDGIPGQWFHFNALGGARVRLRVTSQAFDTVATVLGPRGQSWVNDDANDIGPDRSERPLDSTLDVVIPESGTYHLVVTSYGMRAQGPFRVAASQRPPVLLRDGENSPREGFAGPQGRGRVLGLYAGITAYANQSRLYGCADDARFLAEAMRASHLQSPPDQQVLVDTIATRAAFMTGLARLAERATPDDLVVVFFSGHGGVVPAPASERTELDGTDETIVLADGSLTDTQVANALKNIRAGTVILALDSCHAGGFADDWVNGPGRIGLFSSDADVLSDTAEPLRAGGYLSWHLRRAVLGEADARPRDGVLQAGELTDYLYAGFVADHARMNPPGSNEPYQQLQAVRGSVPWTQALWTYPRAADGSLLPVPALPLASAAP